MYSANHGCADWKNEFRAVYGGFGMAMGALLYVTSYYNLPAKEGVQLCIGFAFLGMAFGRLLSLLVERTGFWPLIFLVIEIVLGSILVAAASDAFNSVVITILN